MVNPMLEGIWSIANDPIGLLVSSPCEMGDGISNCIEFYVFSFFMGSILWLKWPKLIIVSYICKTSILTLS